MAGKQASKTSRSTAKARAPKGASTTVAKQSTKSTKKTKKTKPAKPPKTAAPAAPATKRKKVSNVEQAERMLRRKAAVTSYDTYGCAVEAEEDYFVVPERGETFGRCGGRTIGSMMEKRLCDKLSWNGVAHCHRPRRYEVKIGDGQIAAYSPCIVLRGRGREGKTAIIELLADWDEMHILKIQAFRKVYEAEFYVTFVAPGAVFDRVPGDTYNEAVLPSEIGSLVARLAE